MGVLARKLDHDKVKRAKRDRQPIHSEPDAPRQRPPPAILAANFRSADHAAGAIEARAKAFLRRCWEAGRTHVAMTELPLEVAGTILTKGMVEAGLKNVWHRLELGRIVGEGYVTKMSTSPNGTKRLTLIGHPQGRSSR